MKTLILNADYSPFDIVSYRKAIKLMYSDAVYALDYFNKFILDSKGRQHQIPAVIVLKTYVNAAHKMAPYNKLNVYARDNFKCQYCLKKFSQGDLTIDHIIPRSKWKLPGTPTRFDNVVAACKACNTKKGDKLLGDCGMSLNKIPKGMTRYQAFQNKIHALPIPPEWQPYVFKAKSKDY